MADFPALPIWTDALLGDTYHLSPAEFGAYMRLLMAAWRRPSCSLPDDDALLARFAGAEPDEWQSLRDVVMAFWRIDKRSKEWTQKRLKKERRYVQDNRRKQRGNALKRWNKTKTDDAMAMPNGCQTDAPTPTPTPYTIEPNGSMGADAPLDVDAIFYREGRRILGKQSGALLTKLKRAKGSPEAALKVLEVAQRKADPAAYVGAACREPKDLEAEVAQVVSEALEGWEDGRIRG